MLKLKAVDSIPVSTKKHDLQSLIEEFARSGNGVMEVNFEEGVDYKSARICASCIANAINRSRRYGVRATQRNNRVFLVKTN